MPLLNLILDLISGAAPVVAGIAALIVIIVVGRAILKLVDLFNDLQDDQ